MLGGMSTDCGGQRVHRVIGERTRLANNLGKREGGRGRKGGKEREGEVEKEEEGGGGGRRRRQGGREEKARRREKDFTFSPYSSMRRVVW